MSTKINFGNITQTGVTPGYYVAANITVNAEGQILTAENGTTVNTALSHFNYVIPGTLNKFNGKKRWYAPSNLEIITIRGYLTQAADLAVNLNIRKNGNIVKAFNILANDTYGQSSNNPEFVMSQGDYLTLDLVQAGTIQKGSDLYIQFIYR